MRQFLIFLILCVLSFDISAQEIPKNPNAYDLDSNKTGAWTILYDNDWNITDVIDSVEFYRVITYERSIPSGKVFDFYVNGQKQWEGYLLSDDPEEIMDGTCIWFRQDSSISEIKNYKDGFLNGTSSYYNNEGNLCINLEYKNAQIINYTIFQFKTDSIIDYVLDLLTELATYDNGYTRISLEIIEKIYGRENEKYLEKLYELSAVYYYTEKFNKCLEIDLEYLEITEKIHGKEHPDYALALNNLSMTYSFLGNYERTLELTLECLELREKILGKEHLFYLTTLNNLAQVYAELGDYSNSLELHLECLKLRKKNLSKIRGSKNVNDNQSIQLYNALSGCHQSLNNLGLLYRDLGDFEEALLLFKESLDIVEDTSLFELDYYARALNNLSCVYDDLGNNEKSLELGLEYLEIIEKIHGKEHSKYALALINLASSYSVSGDYNKALELDLECLEIRSKIFGKEHPDYARSLSHVARDYSRLGDYNKALEFRLACLSLREQLLGKNHPDYAFSLDRLSESYLELRKFNKSYVSLDKSIKINFSLFNVIEKNLNNDLFNQSYSNLFLQYNLLFNLSFHVNSSEMIKDQYNNLCLLKGRELSRYSTMISDIYASNDNDLIKDYEDWITINKKIGICFEKTLEERERLGLDLSKLQDDADKLERQLRKTSSVFTITERDYSFDNIVSNLKDDEAYIDIVSIPTYNFDKNQYDSTDSAQYYSYVIKKGDKSAQLIDLGYNSDFDSIYNYYSAYTQERPSNKKFSYGDIVCGNICYKNFWGKLEPYLEGISTVYFSPEGVYSKINPNVLYDSTASSFLMDKYDIVYVSNVEDFVDQKENIQLYERPDDLHAVIIGNPTFLLEENEVVFASNEPQLRSINQDELDSLQRGMLLSDLPGTQTEIDLISNNLKSKGWDVEVVSGVDATETRIKSIEAPKILHIATHGFFFKDQEMVKRSNMISTDNKKAVSNPMTRSGLIFSGAENTMNGEVLADDNGWLNSYEASLLNLRGTELVVLSACETGSGDVQNGKGVYGLQRAIRVAGAESLIMSMWEVDDKATQELMTYFYDYWIDKKMSKKEAFKDAQQKIREKYKHPYYWGAFIMLGQ